MAGTSISTKGFSGVIASEYIPALNQVDGPIGMKVLALAHMRMEGFAPHSSAYRNNNPGNFRPARGTGFVHFPTLADGVKAQVDKLKLMAAGKSKVYKPEMSLIQYLNTYAPPSDNNDPNRYANSIVKTFASQGFKISTDTRLYQIALLQGEDQVKDTQVKGKSFLSYFSAAF